MTLVIALACNDGIVVASDSQVTAPSSGGPVRQTAVKIKPIGSTTLWGASGHLGFVQKIEQLIDGLPSERKNADLDSLRAELINISGSIRKEALDRHRALHAGDTGQAPLADCLYAQYRRGTPRILRIDPNGDDVWLEEFGYGASGIGDTFAYTILMNYDVKALPIRLGRLLAYRVIKDAIDIGAYGLGEPVDIWTITNVAQEGEDELIQAERLSQEEMDAIRDASLAWKEVERAVFTTQLSEE